MTDKSGDFSPFHSIIHCLCSSTSHLFTSRLRLVYWSTLKIANDDLSIFESYYALLCICYCFSHLIGLLSVTWLSLLYKFTRFFYLFSVSLWRRANARNVRLYYPYWQYTDLFIFRFNWISTLPTQHTTFIALKLWDFSVFWGTRSIQLD